MILAIERCGSQPVAAFPAGREVDRVAAGLPMKTSSHVIFGRRAGLAAVLAGNAKYISYVMQYTYPIMNACQTYEIYWGI